MTPPDGGRGQKQWVLSRALCRFATFSLPQGLAPADRERALKLMIDEASPYATTGYLAEWGKGEAGAWLWDQEAVTQAMITAGHDPRAVVVLPETALQQPGETGARLVEVLDGHEGQVWRGGLLKASRYWPRQPDQAEWIRFLRASGDPEALRHASVTAPGAPVWLERPWPRRSAGSLFSEFRGWKVAAAIGCCAVLPFAYQVGQIAVMAAEARRLGADLRRIESEAAPVLAARDAAVKSAARVRQLEALRPYPGPVEVMARIAEKLPTNGTVLQDLNYQQGEVRFTLTGQPNFDAPFYVRALSSVPIFTDVNAENSPAPGTLVLRLKLVRQTS